MVGVRNVDIEEPVMPYSLGDIFEGEHYRAGRALLARLRGMDMDHPYDVLMGERPETAVIEEYRRRVSEGQNLETFVEAIKNVAREELSPLLNQVAALGSQEDDDIEPWLWLERFFLVLRDTVHPIDIERLSIWLVEASYWRRRDRLQRDWELVMLALIEAAAVKEASDLGVRTVIARLLEDESLCHEVALRVGRNDPDQFGYLYLKQYIKEVDKQLQGAERKIHGRRFVDTLREILEVAQLRGLSSQLSGHIRNTLTIIIDSASRRELREAIIASLVLSGWPAKQVLSIDDKYWSLVPAPDPLSDTFENEWEPQMDRARRKYGSNRELLYKRPKTLSINIVPYTEHVLLLLFSLVLKKYFGYSVRFREVGWAGAWNHLKLGTIQVALHNDSLAAESDLERVKDTQDVLKWQGYDLLLRTDHVDSVLQSKVIPEDDVRYFMERSPMEIQDCVSAEQARVLRPFLEGTILSVPSGTDMEQVMQELVESIGVEEIALEDHESVEGLEGFINGDYQALCPGANDTAFLSRFYEREVWHACRLFNDPPTFNRFWINSELHEGYREFFDMFEDAWYYTVDLWKAMTDGEVAGSLRSALKDYLVIHLNRLVHGGNLESFREINDIINTHDELLPRPAIYRKHGLPVEKQIEEAEKPESGGG